MINHKLMGSAFSSNRQQQQQSQQISHRAQHPFAISGKKARYESGLQGAQACLPVWSAGARTLVRVRRRPSVRACAHSDRLTEAQSRWCVDGCDTI
jgi:hypothetical protein